MSTPLHGSVLHVERLTSRLVRVVLGGDGLESFEPTEFTDQYVNVLFAPPGAPYRVPFDVEAARASGHRPVGRRYTVRRWDPSSRELTIDFVTHGDVGVAGRWANQARPGDLLQFVGPTGSYRPDPAAACHLMVGDESALPAIAASLEAIPPGRRAVSVVVVDDETTELAMSCPGALEAHWVHRCHGHDESDALVAAVAGLELPVGSLSCFVHGEAAETRAVRRHLLAERGVARDRISVSPYWRRGADDEAWRAVKQDWLTDQERDVS